MCALITIWNCHIGRFLLNNFHTMKLYVLDFYIYFFDKHVKLAQYFKKKQSTIQIFKKKSFNVIHFPLNKFVPVLMFILGDL